MTVLVAGDFGHFHQGHLDHIMKAYALGDFLIIVTHTDQSILERKGYEPIPLWARITMLRAILSLLGGKGKVVLAEDKDGKCYKSLEKYHPDIFAKGGDRADEASLPLEEVEVCRVNGIKIIYGVGQHLNDSRRIAGVQK